MAAQRKYKPTFSESKPRPVVQRLTPLAWFCVFLIILALIGALIVTIRKLTDNNGTQTLDQRLGRPAATQATAVPAVEAPIVAQPVNSAETVPTAAQPVAPAEVGAPTVVPVATVAVPVAQAPAAVPAAPTNGVTWAAEMTQQADGSWMAPQGVVAQASSDIKAYYESARNRTLEEYLQQRNQILATYYVGDGLQLMNAYEAKRAQYGMNKSGEVSVEVKNFAQDGQTAQIAVTTKNWVNDIFDIRTKQLTKSDFKQQDSTLNLAIRFDLAAKRWKIEKVLDVVRLR